jgi:copper chaperone NosL
MHRRAFLLAASALVASAVACKRSADDRCAFCGMKIDPASAWRAVLVSTAGPLVQFDTPRCALLSWRTGKTAASAIRVQEFYDRTWKDGAELRFAFGSDVLGPMGPDVVPIDPARAAKFRADHGASDIVALAEITPSLLDK